MRNVLALLQVAIAIAAVTAVITDVLPAFRQESHVEEATTFEVRYGVRTGTSTSWRGIFHADDAQFVLDNADSIEAASVYDSRPTAVVRVGDERWAVSGIGSVNSSYSGLVDMEIVSGSFFSEAEATEAPARVAVISEALAHTIFGDRNPIGQRINLRPEDESNMLMGYGPRHVDQQAVLAAPGTELQIIGVYRLSDEFGGLVWGGAPHLLIPAQYERTLLPMALPEGVGAGSFTTSMVPLPAQGGIHVMTYSEILIKPRAGMVREAEQEVRSLLRSRLQERGVEGGLMDGVEPDIMVHPIQNRAAMAQRGRLQGAIIMGAMGLVALVVAGFAVFTTTLANLSQRTRDIGLARSIGATRGYVLRDVVVESALLSGIGGLVGALAAYPLGQLLAPLRVSLEEGGAGILHLATAGLVGIALAMFVGAVAALYPAWTVARLMPAEAWREGRA